LFLVELSLKERDYLLEEFYSIYVTSKEEMFLSDKSILLIHLFISKDLPLIHSLVINERLKK
jgi:hypothetical protein